MGPSEILRGKGLNICIWRQLRDSGSGSAFKMQNITVAGTSGLTVFLASNHAGLDWNLR